MCANRGRRPAGRRTDLYQQMLGELPEQICYMDEHGYYGVGFTDHHFRIEGEEVSTNPIMLGLYFGMQTRRSKLGQFGLVLPSHNPLRKDLYYDHFEIIKKCWQQDAFSHHSPHWQIPAPNTRRAAAEVTRNYGAGIDDQDVLTAIGTVPATYNKRMRDLFQPFSVSESSIRWAMENDCVPVTLLTHPEAALSRFRAAQEAANLAGRNYRLGEKIGLVREVIVAATDAEAIARQVGSIIWCNFFAPFGFNAAVATPGEGAFEVPNNFETMAERGLVIYGSPDTVKRKLADLFEKLPAEYFWMFTCNGLVPQRQMTRHLEPVTTKVLPEFCAGVG